jgi:hypothetical protein
MPNHSRELLLTTKAAEKWQEQFDAQVDSIIETINKIDTLDEVAKTTEIIDVYHHTAIHTTRHAKRGKRILFGDRPFEFLTFRN